MKEPELSFFSRFSLAFGLFFRALSDAAFAARVMPLYQDEARAAEPASARTAAPPAFRQAAADSALQLLGLLQQDGRLIDFLQEDITGFEDAEVGAAARVVHEGCRKVVREHFEIQPIRNESEGSRLTLQQGFDPGAVRLTGNITGQPPFTGNLVHRGWRVGEVKLPRVADGHDTRVLAPAEVEL